MEIIVIQLRVPRFPRCCYLVKEVTTVERFLRSAFILRGMRWDLIPGLIDIHESPDLHAAFTAAPTGTTPREFFEKVFPFTMIPISTFPTPRGHRIKVNELHRVNPPPREGAASRFWRYARDNDRSSPRNLLFEAMKRTGVKVEGTIYDTPCATCLKLFGHIAGACTLVKTQVSGELAICHMDILASSGTVPTVGEVSHPSALPIPAID